MQSCTLSLHDRELLSRLNESWQTQFDLKTSRQTINKLFKAGIVAKKKTNAMIYYLPESSACYRLTEGGLQLKQSLTPTNPK